MKIQKVGDDETVILPDESDLSVIGTAKLTLAHHNYREQINFNIVDLKIPFDLIIGDDWMTEHEATLQWVPTCLKLWKNDSQFVMKAEKAKNCNPNEPRVNLLNAMHAKRAFRKGL